MKDIFSLEGKKAVIIGGGGDLGCAVATGLISKGAEVAIVDLNKTALHNALSKIEEDTGKKALGFSADVTSEEEVENLAKDVVEIMGTVHILVNSQGYNKKFPAFEFPMDEWDKIYAVNVRSMMICSKFFGRYMKEQNYGKIINLSSIASRYGVTNDTSIGYASSKGAVNSITTTLAAGWAKHNITVNGICPILTVTGMMIPILEANPQIKESIGQRVPLGNRLGLPQDIVGPVLFFASDASAFVTGQLLCIDGGLSTLQ